MDGQLQEYLSQEFTDAIAGDDLDKIISITKYVPEVVRVENTYTYNSEKSRRVEFHLRVLIKALLEQLQIVKTQYNCEIEID